MEPANDEIHFRFLDRLRELGVSKSGAYHLVDTFGLKEIEARKVWREWMNREKGTKNG